jgi:hypothetical protein
MNNQTLENTPTALTAHKYPRWILIFAGIIIISIVYSLILLPNYVTAAKNIVAAKDAFQRRSFDESAQLYMNVLETLPSSNIARIGAAEALFSNRDNTDDEAGLYLLEGITLSNNDWARIVKVMPIEYQKYFSNVEE